MSNDSTAKKINTGDYPTFSAKVLVAEDNLINQRVIRDTLKKYGLTVEIAANGKLAIEALEKNEYDLVFMDCLMPEMDGYEATKQIRSGTKPKTLIVAMTANAMSGDREKCIQAGMNDYISKPIDRSILTDILKKYLGSKSTTPIVETALKVVKSNKDDEVLVFDESVIGKLKELEEEDPNLIKDLAGIFLSNMPKSVSGILEASKANDYAQAKHLSHSAKSSAGSLGLMKLKKLCEEIEVASIAKNEEDLNSLVSKLEKEYDIAKNELNKYLERK